MQLCTLDDCAKPRYKGGLCHVHARQAGLVPRPGLCATEGCRRQARTTAEGSQCRKHGQGGTSEYDQMARQKCPAYKCGNPRAEGMDTCRRHGAKPARRLSPTTDLCVHEDCTTSRFKARLCGRHYSLLAHEISECGHPRCAVPVWRADYCGSHDIGLDFAAGDWFDWVAVQQMFEGRHDKARKPALLEVLALMKRAEQSDMPYADMARLLGVTPQVFERWRYYAVSMGPKLRARQEAA